MEQWYLFGWLDVCWMPTLLPGRCYLAASCYCQLRIDMDGNEWTWMDMDMNGRTWVDMGRREWTWIGIDAPVPHVAVGGPPQGWMRRVLVRDPQLENVQRDHVRQSRHPTVWTLSSASTLETDS